jgi:hypothetical protein
MMKVLYWDRLTEITKTQKPFRGTTNRYPIGDRRHNTKCFYVEELNGETVYKITYGKTHVRIPRTKEEYEEEQKANKSYADQIIYQHRGKDIEEYFSYEVMAYEIGIVRSDNTFEFTAPYYGQGINQIMSNWGYGWFYSSSRHGGMVYRQGHDKDTAIFHPIFKGLRLYLDKMWVHDSSRYQIIGKRISRKNAKQFLTKYEDFYKVNEVMFKSIDWKTMMDTTVDVITPLVFEQELSNYYLSDVSKKSIIKWADENINVAPLDSALAFAVGHDISNMYQRVRGYVTNNNYYSPTEYDPMTVYANIKRNLNKELYKRHNEVMKDVEFDMGRYYPPSDWGVTILVNGKEVEQY